MQILRLDGNSKTTKISVICLKSLASAMQLSPTGVTVTAADGKLRGSLGVTEGNSSLAIIPSNVTTGTLTVTGPDGNSVKVQSASQAVRIQQGA